MSQPTPQFMFKRGAWFVGTVLWQPQASGPATLAGCTVTSALQTKFGRRYPLAVTPAADHLGFSVQATSTALWELGDAQWDAKIVVNNSGLVITLPTMCGTVVERITP